jgi:hypothetical protein
LTNGTALKLKSFCTAKETVTTQERQHMEWKKIFACYVSDKELKAKIYRELKKLTLKRIKNPLNKWANELNR